MVERLTDFLMATLDGKIDRLLARQASLAAVLQEGDQARVRLEIEGMRSVVRELVEELGK